MMVSFGMLFAMNQMDFTDPWTEKMCIVIYGIVQSLVFTLYGYLFIKIKAFEAEMEGKEQATFIVKAPSLPMGMENPEPDQEMTNTEYDMAEFFKMAKQSVIGVAICLFIYTKWESPRVLFLQVLSTKNDLSHLQNVNLTFLFTLRV